MPDAFNQEISKHPRLRRASALGLLIGLILISFPAVAEVYPVRGVWTAVDTEFPAAANETCIAVRNFGVEAVSKKSISEMIIFAGQKRFDVKGDVQTEATIKSITVADGGFRITETPTNGARRLGFKRTTTYFLTVIDLQTIEIWDGLVLNRYAKCGPERPPI
jgi:hypothetical protein